MVNMLLTMKLHCKCPPISPTEFYHFLSVLNISAPKPRRRRPRSSPCGMKPIRAKARSSAGRPASSTILCDETPNVLAHRCVHRRRSGQFPAVAHFRECERSVACARCVSRILTPHLQGRPHDHRWYEVRRASSTILSHIRRCRIIILRPSFLAEAVFRRRLYHRGVPRRAPGVLPPHVRLRSVGGGAGISQLERPDGLSGLRLRGSAGALFTRAIRSTVQAKPNALACLRGRRIWSKSFFRPSGQSADSELVERLARTRR